MLKDISCSQFSHYSGPYGYTASAVLKAGGISLPLAPKTALPGWGRPCSVPATCGRCAICAIQKLPGAFDYMKTHQPIPQMRRLRVSKGGARAPEPSCSWHRSVRRSVGLSLRLCKLRFWASGRGSRQCRCVPSSAPTQRESLGNLGTEAELAGGLWTLSGLTCLFVC